MNKIFYNEASASRLGWDPCWFGCKEYDEDLVKSISNWQRKCGIKADGMCGPTTYRRIRAEREANSSLYTVPSIKYKKSANIIFKGDSIPIEWESVSLWSESDGLKCHKFSRYTSKRDIKMFVNHWDVCLNSDSCARVLNNRGISVHFCIDNDGTIHQLMDMNNAAWHAGSRKWNHSSVGVEISNAYYPKYQSWYIKHGFGERPLVSGELIHGRSMETFTGFYNVQIEALKALWKACHECLDIPYKCPLDSDGNTLKKVSTSAAANRFKGFVSHYHLTNRKIDCAGLDIEGILKEIR